MSAVILIGNYPPPISGQSIAFKTLVDDFKKNKKKYFFVNTVEKDGKRDLLSRSFDYIKIILKLLYILLFKKTVVVYHILSSNKIGFFRDFLIINISFIFRKKIILHSHNGNYNIFFKSCSVSLQKVISSTINKADKIILLSKRLTNTFFFVNDKKKLEYVTNGISTKIKKGLIKTTKVIDVLFLSNLIESKGYLDLLDAAIMLNKEGVINKFHFHFAGAFMLNKNQDKSYNNITDAKNIFFNKIKENNLQKYITYHGVVFGKIKSELLEKSNLFILPTYYEIEAQPITIIEAMAYECAIYSTEFRAIPEMLKNNFNGEFIEAENPYSIFVKLKSITSKKINIYSKNSKRIFKNNFTREKHLLKMFRILNNIN